VRVGDDALGGLGKLLGQDGGDLGGQLENATELAHGVERAVSGERDEALRRGVVVQGGDAEQREGERVVVSVGGLARSRGGVLVPGAARQCPDDLGVVSGERLVLDAVEREHVLADGVAAGGVGRRDDASEGLEDLQCASTSSLSRIRCSARARDAPERWPKTTGESIRT
jgi:hypothetical protein